MSDKFFVFSTESIRSDADLSAKLNELDKAGYVFVAAVPTHTNDQSVYVVMSK